MPTLTRLVARCAIVFTLVSAAAAISAEPEPSRSAPVDPELFAIIAQLDENVFAAFNAGDLEAQLPYFDKDLEFYHDKGGFSDYAGFIESSRRLFASKDRPRRTLVKGSLEVFPIKGYGAVQIGSHLFCQGKGQPGDCRTFRFVHVWRYQNNEWKITRVISYDH